MSAVPVCEFEDVLDTLVPAIMLALSCNSSSKIKTWATFMPKGVLHAFVPCSYMLAPCLVMYLISSLTTAMPGEVAMETAAAGGAAAAGQA